MELHFGSVQLLFKALDADGSSTVSYSELRRTCHRLKWPGEVHLLLDCLDMDRNRDVSGNIVGRRSLPLEEIVFLDSWRVEPEGDTPVGARAVLAMPHSLWWRRGVCLHLPCLGYPCPHIR